MVNVETLKKILLAVSPHIRNEGNEHIGRIINQGCLSLLNYEEEYKNKHFVLQKGNRQTFLQHPRVTSLTMNKEEKISHVLPFKVWVVYYFLYCRATPQGIQEKHGHIQVIFDSLTQTIPDKVVLNHKTSKDFEAIINFGKTKINLFINIFNWRITYPREIIHLALADTTACFCFPGIAADLTGAFKKLAEKLYFISISHVFRSNTSASSWEALQ